jgi:hypothetical protein
MTKYYFTDGKERFGPFTIEELKDKNIKPETLVWKEGLVDWVSARNLSDLQVLFEVAPVEEALQITPAAGLSYEPPPKSWLIESVLVTLFCCMPLGIVGIILSMIVESLWKDGHRDAAKRVNAEAARWVKWGFILGMIIIFLYILFVSSGVMKGFDSLREV